MEVEDFLYDLVWKDNENVFKAIEIVNTQAQILMMTMGIMIPLLYYVVPILNVWSKQTLLFLFPILSFVFAFCVMVNSASPIDFKLDKIIEITNEGNLKEHKIAFAEKIGKISENAKKVVKTKVKLLNISMILLGSPLVPLQHI